MRKPICMVLAFIFVFICSCANASVMSDKYDEALDLILQKKYREASVILDEISIYNDASQLSAYCKSIAEGNDQNYSTAYTMLDSLGDYKDASLWSTYFKACEAQQNGDVAQAYELFNSIPLFLDAAERIQGVQAGKNSEFKKEYMADDDTISEGLITIKKDDLYGYADISGNIVLKPKWDLATSFDNGYAVVSTGGTRRAVIDKTGKEILHNDGWIFQTDGFFEVWKADSTKERILKGLLDSNGNTIVNTAYDDISRIGSNLFLVEFDGLKGLVKAGGKEILKPVYSSIIFINDHMIGYVRDGKFTVIDPDGNVITDSTYDYIGPMSNGLAPAKVNEKYGYIDESFNMIIDPVYDAAYSFNDAGLAMVMSDGKWGCIDTSGNIIIPLEYDEIQFQKNTDFISTKQGEKYGLANILGEILIPCIYDSIYYFGIEDGITTARKNEKYGYVDSHGNVIIEPKFQRASDFAGDIALVQDEAGIYFINREGIKIADLPYECLSAFLSDSRNGTSIVTISLDKWISKSGVVNYKGENILNPDYSKIQYLNDNLLAVTTTEDEGKKTGLYNTQGQMIFEPKYEKITRFSDDGYALVIGETDWYIIDTEGNIVF